MRSSQAMLATTLALPALSAAAAVTTRQAAPACAFGITDSRALLTRAELWGAGLTAGGDVVDQDLYPATQFNVSYGAKAMDLGTSYGLAETLQAPTYDFNPPTGSDLAVDKYTVIVVDPDAPGPKLPLLRQFLHLIEYDVTPKCVGGGAPKTLAPYMPLTPLSIAQHRYTYLLYRQPPGAFNPTISPIDRLARAPFDLAAFTTKYNLTLISANYMREGLENLFLGLLPGATVDGTGYSGPLDGSAEPLEGIGNLLSGLGNMLGLGG